MAKVVLPRSLQRLLVHLFVGLFRGNYFFVHGQEKKEGGDGLGLDLWVELCTPPKYWHSTSPVLVETKVLNPCSNIDIPTWLFYCRTHCGLCPFLPDYCELFAFPLLDGFSSEKHCEWQRCLSFRWWRTKPMKTAAFQIFILFTFSNSLAESRFLIVYFFT